MNKSRTDWMAGMLAAAFITGCGSGTEGENSSGDVQNRGEREESGSVEREEPPVTRPIDTTQLFEWPPISVDTGGTDIVIVLEAPDPGWMIEVDGVDTLPAGKRVYVTIWRPEPGQMFPQVITEKRIETGVAADEMLEVVARLRHSRCR